MRGLKIYNIIYIERFSYSMVAVVAVLCEPRSTIVYISVLCDDPFIMKPFWSFKVICLVFVTRLNYSPWF